MSNVNASTSTRAPSPNPTQRTGTPVPGTLKGALATLVLFGLGLGAARLELVRKLEWKTEDARLELRGFWSAPPHEALCLIGVDEKSIEDFGQWPFARTYHGQLVEWLSRTPSARPAVLAWDLLFVDRGYDWQWDQFFADRLREASFPVVLGAASDAGEAGLRDLLARWQRELQLCMCLTGVTRIIDINHHHLDRP